MPRRIVLDIDDTARPRPRAPAAVAVPRPLRQPLLPADPHLRGDDRQAGGGDPQARQDARRRRGRPRPAPCRARHPRRWPRVDIVIRGDSHYARPEAMDWLERHRVGYVFGLAGNRLLDRVADLAEDVAVRPRRGSADKVRRFARLPLRGQELESRAQRVVARVEATDARQRQPLHRDQPRRHTPLALRAPSTAVAARPRT